MDRNSLPGHKVLLNFADEFLNSCEVGNAAIWNTHVGEFDVELSTNLGLGLQTQINHFIACQHRDQFFDAKAFSFSRSSLSQSPEGLGMMYKRPNAMTGIS